jgi:hypothetical protein
MIEGGVVVGYLSGGDTRIEFTRSIAGVMAYTTINKVCPSIGQLPHVSGPRIAAGRNHLVEAFLATPGEWLFMVDDDMVFNDDTIERFLRVADREKAPIVGGLAFGAGRDGFFPTLFRLSEDVQAPISIDTWELDSLVDVDATGAACLFIHRSVFEKLAEEYSKPWQWFQETTLGQNSVGEDMTFCLRARAAGFPIVVDTSIKFGHVKPRVIDEDEYFRWLETHRFVITGTGRCGTGYMANALMYNRVRCGHETLFTPEGKQPNPFLRGDSSWMAAPHLPAWSGYVLHVVRNPLDVVNSFVGIGLFDESHDTAEVLPYREYARQHAPEVFELEDPVERAMAWYVFWNRMIEPWAHKRVQVENVSGDDLYDVIRYAGAHHAPWEIAKNLAEVPKDVNSRPRADLTWDDLPDGDLKDGLRAMGKAYGYAV